MTAAEHDHDALLGLWQWVWNVADDGLRAALDTFLTECVRYVERRQGAATKRIGVNIARERAAAGLSLAELGAAIGRPPSYVSRVEAGTAMCLTAAELVAAAGVLGCPVGRLVGEGG